MAGCIRNDCASEALSLFSRMHREGFTKPNEFTFVSALQACSLTDNLTQAYQIYSLVVRSGLESNVFLLNAFLTALVRHGKLTEALQIFETSTIRDIVTWNTMMGGYLQFSCEQVPVFWRYMICKGIKPDEFTFASALTGLAAISYLEMGMQVHTHLVKSGYGDDICVGNSLVDM
jgi:pentatricopeptide repeat protein